MLTHIETHLQVLVLHGNATLMYNKFIQGDSDWIEARLTFPVPAPTTATVYFRRLATHPTPYTHTPSRRRIPSSTDL